MCLHMRILLNVFSPGHRAATRMPDRSGANIACKAAVSEPSLMMRKGINMFWSDKYQILAVYNGEVGRGILHTDEHKEKMELLQEEYKEDQIKWANNNGWIVI